MYAVGAVDGAPTHFEGYPWSGLNRAIVQHALQQAGLAGRTVHAVSGLPVSAFYRKSGEHRQQTLAKKRDSLKQAVRPVSGALPAGIAFHEVIPEALAAWYDDVIIEQGDGVTLEADRVAVPVAIVDIGGRTTDYVVVKNQGILHDSSGSLQCGMLDVKQLVTNGIQERFDLEVVSEQLVAQAVECKVVRLRGTDHDIAALVESAKREVVERIHAETRRQLGLGVELDRVLFVGGGKRGPGRAYRQLVPASGHRRPPGLRQCPWHAEIPALCLRGLRCGLSTSSLPVSSVVTAVQWQTRHRRTV